MICLPAPFVRLSVSLSMSTYLPSCLSTNLPIYQSTYLSTPILPIYLTYPSICLFVHPSVRPSVHPSIHPSIHPFFDVLSVYLPISVCLSLALKSSIYPCLSVSCYLSLLLFLSLSLCFSLVSSISCCLSISLSLCLSASLPLCLSASLCLCLSLSLSLCLSVSLSLCLSLSLSICLSVCLSPARPPLPGRPSVSPLSACMFVCPPISLWRANSSKEPCLAEVRSLSVFGATDQASGSADANPSAGLVFEFEHSVTR